MTISSPIEIRPNLEKDDPRHPDYRVYAPTDVEIGTGRIKTGESSHAEHVSLAFSVPEFGPKRLMANLGKMTGQDDANKLAIIWNPEP